MKANRLLPLLAILGMVLFPAADGCSCMPQHPQTAFCESEYVIVAQVLRKTASKNTLDAYKIAIKKEYKMSDAARKLLRDGKLYTPSSSAMCGVTLEPNKLYMIAADSEHVGLCHFIQPYANLTIVEKRGLAGIYRKGCKCRIQLNMGLKGKAKAGSCNWSPFSPKGICETSYGSCVPAGVVNEDGTPNKCHWRRSPRYGQCVAKNGGK